MNTLVQTSAGHPLRQHLIELVSPSLPAGQGWPRETEPLLFLLGPSTALNGVSCYVQDIDDLIEISITARNSGYATNVLHMSLDIHDHARPVLQVSSETAPELVYGGVVGDSHSPGYAALFRAVSAWIAHTPQAPAIRTAAVAS